MKLRGCGFAPDVQLQWLLLVVLAEHVHVKDTRVLRRFDVCDFCYDKGNGAEVQIVSEGTKNVVLRVSDTVCKLQQLFCGSGRDHHTGWQHCWHVKPWN